MLNDRLQRMKKKLLNTRPNLTAERLVLATEAYQKFAGDAIPIFRAKVLSYVLENMTILILDDEMIVGTPSSTFRGASLFPEYTSTDWLSTEIDDFPTRETDPIDVSKEDRETILEYLKYWEGKSIEDIAPTVLPETIENARKNEIITLGCRNGCSGETMPNHKKFLTIGLSGFIKECEENIAREVGGSKEKQEKIDFWKGCILVCKSIIRFAERYAEHAEELAKEEKDQKRKNELLTIAKNCRNIPANPPSSFHEALQFVWFIQVVFHIEAPTTACGFGRFDQYMFPFFNEDKEAGILDDESALELLECFYLKTNEVLE
ncbi:MAG: hypothetical protein MI799_23900, partial [Desulfobacterales bacterium]|nr:hypothetical protein [Desulfobacterales bacterium]